MKKFIIELVLITSDLDKEIKVKMNASDFTMRVVLLIVMGHLDTNNFYFILFYFSDFTLLYFSFEE